jgi:hypothetical protein
MESLPAFCLVSHFLAIGVGQEAYKDNFPTIQSIFDLVVPTRRNVLRIKWKDEVLDTPFFCNVQNTTGGARILKDKAFPYGKYRDIFARLGRVAGFEKGLELYQLRRASGRNINSEFIPLPLVTLPPALILWTLLGVLTSEERNRTMGHRGSTYEKYYMPTHIARDFQSIYFGSPSEDLLIESVARMGLTRDRHAPTGLDNDQLEEVRNNPELVALRNERENFKNQIYDQGYYPITTAEGTELYKRYKDAKRKISSTYQKLHRQRFDKAILDFHESVDTIEIARQLSRNTATDVLALPTVEFEIRERATVAGMLFKPFTNDKARTKFIHALARLCRRQETPKRRVLKRNQPDFVMFQANDTPYRNKRKKIDATLTNVSNNRKSPEHQHSQTVKLELSTFEADDNELVECPHLYPTVLPHPVCLICIGNDEFMYERRMRPIPRKDVLKKHVESHFRLPEFQSGFQCRHPRCSELLVDIKHFKRHAFDVHKVSH